MKHLRFSLALAVALALLGIGLLLTVRPAVAQQSPDSTTVINSAVLSIYVSTASGQTVNVYPVTATWSESGVKWNNFGNSFNPTSIVSFTSSAGWHAMTVTSQVQAWVNNPSQNFGFVLKQNLSQTEYRSSEYVTSTLRPKLDVCYTRPSASMKCITIQRGIGQSTVADAYVWDQNQTTNYGNSATLYSSLETALASDRNSVLCVGTQYSLLRFDLTTTPNAVTVQSLSARSSVAPDLALAAVGVVSIAGLVVLRRRRLL